MCWENLPPAQRRVAIGGSAQANAGGILLWLCAPMSVFLLNFFLFYYYYFFGLASCVGFEDVPSRGMCAVLKITTRTYARVALREKREAALARGSTWGEWVRRFTQHTVPVARALSRTVSDIMMYGLPPTVSLLLSFFFFSFPFAFFYACACWCARACMCVCAFWR